ncbi:MAG TPA: hypothetical protein VJ793_24885 [Anaerolineae bacterium]|nr:hypothetical protein [Anaerolineae bacterium]
MNIQLEGMSLPGSGRVEVDIRVSADLHITATTARRRVSRMVISEIGNLLHGGEPSLVMGERIRWRVPIILAYPDIGPVGQVGALDVDVETGEVLASPEQLDEIRAYAQYAAQHTPPATA